MLLQLYLYFQISEFSGTSKQNEKILCKFHLKTGEIKEKWSSAKNYIIFEGKHYPFAKSNFLMN